MVGEPQNAHFCLPNFPFWVCIYIWWSLNLSKLNASTLEGIWIFHFEYFNLIVIWAEAKTEILFQLIWVFAKELFTKNFMDT